MFQSIGFSEDIDKGIMKEKMKWIIVFFFKFINCTSNLTSEWNYLLYQIQYNSSNVL